MVKKIYFVYKFTNNPNPNETYKKLEKSFGKGYIFDKKQNMSAANDMRDMELLVNNMRMSICEMG